jgi:hypothetical protein
MLFPYQYVYLILLARESDSNWILSANLFPTATPPVAEALELSVKFPAGSDLKYHCFLE